MEDFIISIDKIEELQTLADTGALDAIFQKAKRSLTGGGLAVLVRGQGKQQSKIEEISSLDELEQYRKQVYKYL